jgi:para-nitrobenzyl esterase
MMPGMDRREFVRRASVSALANWTFANRCWGQTAKFAIVETNSGKVRGLENRGVKIFKGIPYGANTEGANRFMPPRDAPKWVGIRDALEYGHSAPQSDLSPKAHVRPTPPHNAAQPSPVSGPSIYAALAVPGEKITGEGEDCLVLNVWTPALNDGGRRPVMLWLHGGGFRGGSGSNPGWDGTNLCLRGDVVVITINHRVNACGFANFSEFSSDFAASGQVGMLDIVHALKWVRTNIEQFGGDPNTVMIFGQSGGGRKCETLLAMPSAKGLFHRAAIESGIAIKIVEEQVAVENAERLLNKLGIGKTDVHRVQHIPLDQILIAAAAINRELGAADQDSLGFAPSVDGKIIPQHPFYPAASAVSPEVPIIIGSTRTEYTGLTTETALWHLNEPEMQMRIKALLGDQSGQMVDLYRRYSPQATPSDIFFLIESDYAYGTKTWKIAEWRAALGKSPVYLYYFAWASPVQGGQLQSPHNIEWPFAFDNIKLCANLTGDGPDAMSLADKVSDAWIAFARTGNPNTAKLPHWPEFDPRDRATMIFDNVCKVEDDPLREKRIAMFQAVNLN